MLPTGLEDSGYAVVEGVLDPSECEALCTALADLTVHPRGGGHRNLLARPEVAALCRHPRLTALARAVLGADAFVCKTTLFDKTPQANWKVTWHQDLAVAVQGEARPAGWKGWSFKAGVTHAQPPQAVLENMLALRLHLDDCNAGNGALRLIPGSHREGRLDEAATEAWKTRGTELRCDVRAGGVLLMRPLLLHASSAGAAPRQRRVLHLEFAAQELPAGLDWAGRVAIAPG